MWKRLLFGCAALFFLSAACAPRRTQAQFIGYTSPQTVSQAFTMNCGGLTVVPNIGQSVHMVNYQASLGPSITSQVTVVSSNNNVEFYSISSEGRALRGQVFGYGYAAITNISFLCFNAAGTPASGAGNGTVNIQYSGTSVYSDTAGSGLETKIRKVISLAVAANTSRTMAISTPFGSTAGLLLFNYAAVGPVGSTLTIRVTDNSLPVTTVATFTLAAATGTQVFRVPHFPVIVGGSNSAGGTAPQTNLEVVYTTGGASADTYILMYYFDPPGYTLPSGTGTAATQVQGPQASGATSNTNPVQVAGVDNAGLVRTFRINPGGLIALGNNLTGDSIDAISIQPVNDTGGGRPFSISNFTLSGRGTDAWRAMPSCDETNIVNQSVVALTEIIPLSGSTRIRICTIALGSNVGTINTFQLSYGTGANCATGTTPFTGIHQLPANTATQPVLVFPNGGIQTPAGQAVCLALTAATQVTGTISFSQY